MSSTPILLTLSYPTIIISNLEKTNQPLLMHLVSVLKRNPKKPTLQEAANMVASAIIIMKSGSLPDKFEAQEVNVLATNLLLRVPTFLAEQTLSEAKDKKLETVVSKLQQLIDDTSTSQVALIQKAHEVFKKMAPK